MEALKQFLTDEFLVVSLPRVLVLQNWRLGMFYKILQLLSIIVALMVAVSRNGFLEKHDVHAWGVNLWREAPVAPVPGTLPPSCTGMAAYVSEDDPTFKYKPTSCKAFPDREFSSVGGSKLFLPTFVDNTKAWDASGDECGAASRKACSELGAIFEEANGQCSCTLNEQFLVLDAGEQSVRFVYGYEVDTSDGQRRDLRRGGILSSTTSAGPEHELEPQSHALVTQFRARDGAACTFGGKSRWLQTEALGGITGTLNELLVCAGVTLDSDPATLVTGTLSAPSHLRTMGFKLELQLHLGQDLVGDLNCDVRVVATPITTVAYRDSIISSAFPKQGAVAHQRQRVHGVTMDVRVTGQIYTFRLAQVVRGVVDVFVVLQFPKMIVYFVAMYTMGIASRVHRSTARTRLNIFAKFHSSIAKVLLAEVAYRGLINNFTDRMNNLGSVTPHFLLERLEDIFRGDLQKDELTKLAAVVFTSMDKDHDDEIVCSEFLQSSTDDGEINLSTMIKFFHSQDSERNLRLQRILDDTEQRTKSLILKNRTRLFTPELEDVHTAHHFTCHDSDVGVTIDTGKAGNNGADSLVVGFDQNPEHHREHVVNDAPNSEKDIADLKVCMDKMTHHEKELQKLFDHHKHCAEALMKRVQDLEHNLLQALQVLKEALETTELSRQASLSPAPPTRLLADMEVVQASIAATRHSSKDSGATTRSPISQSAQHACHSGG